MGLRVTVSASETDDVFVALFYFPPLFSEMEIALLRLTASSTELDAAFVRLRASCSCTGAAAAFDKVYAQPDAHHCSSSNQLNVLPYIWLLVVQLM